MKIDLGLHLYLLREECRENFEHVLKAVSYAGLDGVEFFSFFDIEANRMKQLLKNYNLKSMGTHTSIDVLENGLDELMRYNTIIGSEYVTIGYHTSEDRDGWLRLSEVLETSGEQLRRNGFKLMYHNHAHEFEPKFNGVMAQNIILSNTSPENVSLELDCYWVDQAGINPEAYLKNNLSRIKTIHLKEMDRNENKTTEVGTGSINNVGLYNICLEAGFDWILFEQDHIINDYLKV